MKKVIKSRIFLVIICGIIFTSVGAYAAVTYKASDVLYTSSDGTSMTVNDALNDIYQIKTLGDATASDILNGKTAIVQGKLVTGNVEVPDGTYYINVGVNAAYNNVSAWSLAASRSATYVIKLVIENGSATVSWYSASYVGNADLNITPGSVSLKTM